MTASPLLGRGFTIQFHGLAHGRTRHPAQQCKPMIWGLFCAANRGAQNERYADGRDFHQTTDRSESTKRSRQNDRDIGNATHADGGVL
jgi:hypothetical protein